MGSRTKKTVGVILFILLISGLVMYVYPQFWGYGAEKDDIYYIWIDGQYLLNGDNPYARILTSNMRQNQKYPTYFPLFYIFAYVTQKAGLKDFSEWLSLWRYISLFFNLGIVSVIFYTLYSSRQILLGLFASLFWLFNRWTLNVALIAHIDFIPIFFLLLSLALFKKNKWLSLFVFSLSLAVKQIAIFLLPLYLIWFWKSSNKVSTKDIFIAFMVILSIPVLISLPFILWNAEAFFKSILFSATRFAEDHFDAPSVDAYAGFIGIPAKLPMLFLMILVYIAAFQRRIGLYTSTLLTMFIFVFFNSVLFRQYMCWVVPLIPLSICDMPYSEKRNV
jgi:uncharacterized membrane protein